MRSNRLSYTPLPLRKPAGCSRSRRDANTTAGGYPVPVTRSFSFGKHDLDPADHVGDEVVHERTECRERREQDNVDRPDDE